ncbi:hypothetical protein WN944_003258 [Citrus x changshan-huyou]|uniref:Transmembrane protein n=1 Tax=Citrus x changshan-huyou TaxID=2935761 RepID=A0AAP0LY89_9ROSI
MDDVALAPGNPAARAKNTVRLSDTPMMMSRTISPAVKCFFLVLVNKGLLLWLHSNELKRVRERSYGCCAAREDRTGTISGVETGERDPNCLVREKGGRRERPELSRKEERRTERERSELSHEEKWRKKGDFCTAWIFLGFLQTQALIYYICGFSLKNQKPKIRAKLS